MPSSSVVTSGGRIEGSRAASADSERPPRGGLSEIRSGVDQAAVIAAAEVLM
jgi:hypothetical protein